MSSPFRPFHTLLIANRGEIALRIMRTARRLGLRTVGVYSDADSDSLHVGQADCAVHIGAAAPRESYLNIDAIIAAALRSGADAVHPGYGFLAENADFARAVREAGLVFVGPSPEAIEAMGNKANAKRLMLAAHVPCVPGYQGEDQSDSTLETAARNIGFPIMVKAAAGGGGRGMRLVLKAGDLSAALTSARSEALSAFGSGELILERAVIEPRHIEIQVFADSHGNVVHLAERDCSVQRRHQKLIEEAPSPAVDAMLRARMGEAAVAAAKSIGYVGAGTMEFLLDRNGEFYFMEMNTRLQVEHAVTEAITGLDLVEWQLRVAAGEPLPLDQESICLNGHAIEVRLTAEDVPAGFLPQSGPVLRWRPPGAGHDVRVDHGLREGGSVPAHYDSMIAKLVAHGATRDEARRKLRLALEDCALLGVASNQRFLTDCLEHPAFAAGEVHTGFITEHMEQALVPQVADPIILTTAALCASGWPKDDADRLGALDFCVELQYGRDRWIVRLQPSSHGISASVCGADENPLAINMRLLGVSEAGVWHVECNGQTYKALHATDANHIHLFMQNQAWRFQLVDARRAREAENGDGLLTAPLAGRIAAVHVALGDAVQAGQVLVVLEAMKMEHSLYAPFDGRIAELSAQVGGQARAGGKLVHVVELTAEEQA